MSTGGTAASVTPNSRAKASTASIVASATLTIMRARATPSTAATDVILEYVV
jgi:hypothetical protein